LANSLACCAVADAILAGKPPIVPPEIPVESLRLGVPQTYVLLAAASGGYFNDGDRRGVW
jgi:hypothetical protein